jgi:hypothetical protein
MVKRAIQILKVRVWRKTIEMLANIVASTVDDQTMLTVLTSGVEPKCHVDKYTGQESKKC